MINPPVLVFCPVYDRRGRNGQDARALMSDGCAAFLDRIAQDDRVTVLIQNDNPHTGKAGEWLVGVRNHLHQYRQAREVMLAGGFEYMLTVESDMHPHPNTLNLLLECDADVAHAPYMYRHGEPSLNLLHVYHPGCRNPGESLTREHRWKQYLANGPVVDVSGSGLGVTLITRRVLENTRFSINEHRPFFCDWWFTKDVWRNSKAWSVRAHMHAVAGHEKPDGEILWPHWENIGVS